MIKQEIRILGIDDSPFDKHKKKNCLVVGTIFRGGSWMDGVISCNIKVDGLNSTKKIAEMINKSRHKEQLQIIMLDGIALGGFNVVDINLLSKKTGLPVVTIMRDKPKMERIKSALKNVSSSEKRLKIIQNAGEITEAKMPKGSIFFQKANIEEKKVLEILKISCTRSLIPEPIRTAHLIAAGITLGESKGRA